MKLTRHFLVALASFRAISTASQTQNSRYCVAEPATLEVQRAIFNQFVYEFYVIKDLNNAYANYVSADYIQHNPFVADGPAAALAFLGPIWPSQNLSIIHQMFELGIGLVHYKDVGFAPLPTAIADIYRMEGTCVVEHWDVIETLPQNATNPHALF